MLVPLTSEAAASTHSVNASITDVVAPTAPVNLVVAVSGETVDVSWDAGTDDQAVDEYIILLDGIEIGRTENTNFSFNQADRGDFILTVRTIDFGDNESPDATAVLSISRGGGGGGGSSRDTDGPAIVSVVEAMDSGHVTLTVTLRAAAQISVQYGQTREYELGEVVVEQARLVHEVVLDGLTQGETYYYQIEADIRRASEFTGSFVAGEQSRAPAVSRIALNDTGDELRLAVADEIESYLIVHNPDRPPLHRFDGDLIYRGSSRTFSFTESDGFLGVFFLDGNDKVVTAQVILLDEQPTIAESSNADVQGLGWRDDIVVTQGIERFTQSDLTTVHAAVPLRVQYPRVPGELADGGVVFVRSLQTGDVSTVAVLTTDIEVDMWQADINLPNQTGQYELVVALYQGQDVQSLYSTPLTITSLVEYDPATKTARAFLRNLLLQIIALFQSLVTI